jgi:hypothetical protein
MRRYAPITFVAGVLMGTITAVVSKVGGHKHHSDSAAGVRRYVRLADRGSLSTRKSNL